MAETLDLLGLASYLTADFVASASSLRQAIELFRVRGDNRGLSSSLSLLALSGGGFDTETSSAAAGSPDEWLGHALEALDTARAIGWRAGETFALSAAGTVSAAHGNPGAGLDWLQEGRELANKIGYHQWVAGATNNLGAVSAALLQWEEALALIAGALGSAYWTRSAMSHLVDLHIEIDELEQADAILTEALEADSTLDSLTQRKLWTGAARLAIARNDFAIALEVVDRLQATAPGKNPGDIIPALSLLRGLALAGQGSFEAAVVELQAAVTHSCAERNLLLLWRIQQALASVYLAAGDERRAEMALDDASATISQVAQHIPDGGMRASFCSQASERLSRITAPGAI